MVLRRISRRLSRFRGLWRWPCALTVTASNKDEYSKFWSTYEICPSVRKRSSVWLVPSSRRLVFIAFPITINSTHKFHTQINSVLLANVQQWSTSYFYTYRWSLQLWLPARPHERRHWRWRWRDAWAFWVSLLVWFGLFFYFSVFKHSTLLNDVVGRRCWTTLLDYVVQNDIVGWRCLTMLLPNPSNPSI